MKFYAYPTMGLKPGKLDPDFLAKLLSILGTPSDDVVIGPSPGVDAAAIRIGDRTVVVTSDPITFVTDDIAYYSLVVNANDLAVMGAEPKFFVTTLLLPEGIEEEAVERIFREMANLAQGMGISLIGGHTEVTPGLDRVIISGTMLGEAVGGRLFSSRDAKIGDCLVITKGIAIEGTSIIAREKKEEVLKHFGEEFLRRAMEFNVNPGISIVKEALLAARSGLIHAMHDITEGGLSMGAAEMATASCLGLLLDLDSVPIFPETQALCEYFGLDPLGLIGSGALLLAVPEGNAGKLLDLFRQEGIDAHIIGIFTEKERGLLIKRDGRIEPLPVYPQDEITKLF